MMGLAKIKFCRGFPAPLYRPLEVQGHVVSSVEVWSRRSDEDVEEVTIMSCFKVLLYQFRSVTVRWTVHSCSIRTITFAIHASTFAALTCSVWPVAGRLPSVSMIMTPITALVFPRLNRWSLNLCNTVQRSYNTLTLLPIKLCLLLLVKSSKKLFLYS